MTPERPAGLDPWFMEAGQRMADDMGEDVLYLTKSKGVVSNEVDCAPYLAAWSQADSWQRANASHRFRPARDAESP